MRSRACWRGWAGGDDPGGRWDAGAQRAAGFRSSLRDQASRDGARWAEPLGAIAAAVGRDGVIAADNAMVAYNGALGALPAYRPRSFLFPTGYGTLGYAIPAGIGAKVGRPSARVVALSGDGGAMFTIAELAAAAQARLALPVVVFDNGGYGEIRHEMRERGDEPLGVDFDSPDFAALGRALGCHGRAGRDGRGAGRRRSSAPSRPTGRPSSTCPRQAADGRPGPTGQGAGGGSALGGS